MKSSLGKLEKVEIRSVWPTEAGQFTPWLAKEENILFLSQELDIDITVIREEEWVGPFKVDILAKETTSDRNIIIENQFGKTDHNHLGQIITYASGLEATAVIWISESFTEEHRAAIDWLNNICNETVAFFGIEIAVYRIGNSDPAPMFNIICQPNNWSKTVKQKSNESELTETKLLQQEYWTRFKEFVDKQDRSFRLQKPSPQHWTSVSVGRSGFHLNAIVNTRDKLILVQLVVSGSNALINFSKLRSLFEDDSKLHLSPDIQWAEKSGKEHHVNMIYTNKDPSKRSEWTDQHRLLYECLQNFHSYFSAKVKNI